LCPSSRGVPSATADSPHRHSAAGEGLALFEPERKPGEFAQVLKRPEAL
jgi:hypothetical protein